ncbi:HAMP domain-containing histidine kinase [Tumebacillus sp. ITR2]|uniref:histidine kinase n=1 Tax=Tumebacillus amylolyticus TaxID=2801339 RepID=A0ABS1JB46_9BACL|nr:HAMP domain-containing sensor histidine kinase [Tumebacillus amylolyticus]MBL0387259.1 HAMP domain-containing histidine kinase [Tumebacillus amylolyticus]
MKANRNLWSRIGRLYDRLVWEINHSLRAQLMMMFVLSLLIAFTVGILTNYVTESFFRTSIIDYSSGRYKIDDAARNLTQAIALKEENGGSYDVQQQLEELEERNRRTGEVGELRLLVVDSAGKVLYKSKKAKEKEVNLHDLLWQSMDQQRKDDVGDEGESTFAYPVEMGGEHVFVIASGSPKPAIQYRPTGNPVPMVVFFAGFFISFYWLSKRKVRYIGELADGLLLISEGQLEHRVPEISSDELGSLAQNINHMTNELQTKIEAERLAERMKNELITNVSHDLRTPLTSVMGYLRLLHEHRYESTEQLEEYVKVAYSKSEQLQGLIEDLFEFTKLSGPGVQLVKQEICVHDLLEQLIEEWVPLFEAEGLSVLRTLPEGHLFLPVDAEKLVRVLENLFSNVVKYSTKPGVVAITLRDTGDGAQFTIENHGEPLTSEELERLFDRFYRVEQARSSARGGSGLGLAIAQNIITLHGGRIWAESEGERVTFQVWLPRT